MLGIDIALLVCGAALLVVAVGLAGGRLGRRAETQQRRLQGEHNAELEKRRLQERCTICGESIDPAHDLWDAGAWWHRGCYREVVR